MKSKNFINIILAILLSLCLFNWNYGFYELIRFLGMIGFSILAYKEKGFWFYLWVLSAMLINPFFKVALGRTIWNIVDVIWLILLLTSIFKENKIK